jgi:hypothetical protein
MTQEEYETRLRAFTEEELNKFNLDFGGGDFTIEERAREFVGHPEYERVLCYHLGLKTEDEKLTEAALRSANAAEKSADIAKGSVIISGVACLVAIVAAVVAANR